MSIYDNTSCIFCEYTKLHVIRRRLSRIRVKSSVVEMRNQEQLLEDKITNYRYKRYYDFDCKICGEYDLTGGKYINILETEEIVFKVRHFLAARKLQDKNNVSDSESMSLDKNVLDAIASRPLPTPPEQADNLIRFLSRFNRPIDTRQDVEGAIIGSLTNDIFIAVYRDTIDRNLITGRKNSPSNALYSLFASVMLTLDGWRYCEKLEKGLISHNKGFMAMDFKRKGIKHIYENAFKPAAKQAGFELFTLGEVHRAGLIDDQMLVEIQTSDFVVADLTDKNPGAYLEAGYAIGLGKPVIFTCEKSVWENDKTHFDANHHRTIIWESDKPEEAEDNLKLALRATLPEKVKISDDKE